MRTNRLLLILTGLALLLLARPAAAQDASAANLQRLAKPITLNVEDARFEDVVEFIRATTGARIDIAWIDNRTGEGMDPDALVSIRIENAQALAVLMHAASLAAADDFDAPTWQLDRESAAIQIGPRARLNKFKRLEIYDIQDMLFVLPDYNEVPQLNLNSVIRQGQGGGGGGIFQQAPDERQEFSQEEEAERIMEILRVVIETDQWQGNGGDGALVRFYEGALLVSAPDYIHRQINGYSFLTGPVGRPALQPAQAENQPSPGSVDEEDAGKNAGRGVNAGSEPAAAGSK